MAFQQHSPPLDLSQASSLQSPFSLISSLNTSLHLFLCLPFTPSPSTCSVSILFIQLNSSLLSTWPNDLSLFHRMTSAMSSIVSMFLTHSLLFLSLKLTPVIHLNILISLLCISLISCVCTRGFTHHFGFVFIYFEAFILKALILFPQFFFQFFFTLSYKYQVISTSAYSISHGRPSLTLCVTASITIMKSSGLSTKPCTPTFIPNHSLTDPSYDMILVLACLYMVITALTNHSSTPSFLMTHSTTFLGTLSKAFSRSTMPTTVPCVFPYISLVTVLQ